MADEWERALAAVHAAAAAAVAAEAEEARERTRALTPTDAGDLKGSFFVAHSGLDAQMGTDSPYAVYVHEDLKDQHDDGQAKYMEAAVTGGANLRAIGDAGARAAERALG